MEEGKIIDDKKVKEVEYIESIDEDLNEDDSSDLIPEKSNVIVEE